MAPDAVNLTSFRKLLYSTVSISILVKNIEPGLSETEKKISHFVKHGRIDQKLISLCFLCDLFHVILAAFMPVRRNNKNEDNINVIRISHS